MTERTYAFHPLANQYRLLEGRDFDELVEDIKANGLIEPIALYEGMILDGRNRYRACLVAGVEPRFEEYTGSNPAIYVDSKNAFRRHDTPEEIEARRERRRKAAVELRLKGLSYRAIGEELGVSHVQARSDVQRGALETDLPIPPTITTADGREYPATRPNGNGHHELAEYEREYNRPVYDEGEGDTSWLDDDEYGRVLVENLDGDQWRYAVACRECGGVVYDHLATRDGDEWLCLDCTPARPQNISDDPDYDGNEWYTPVEYIEMARTLMGGIDTDPASCEWAQERVKAATYYTKDDDGLEQKWQGRVWLNPPYSWPEVEKFTRELCRQYDEGAVTEAVLLVNNCTDAAWFQALLRRFPVCFTAGRIKFERPGLEVFATRQGQAFFYLGDNVAGFAALFGEIGTVLGRLP